MSEAGKIARWIRTASRAPTRFIVAMVLAVTGPAFAASKGPPSIALPAPEGRYPVGTQALELMRTDGTPLPVVAWYPAADRRAPAAPYFPEQNRQVTLPSLAKIFGLPAETTERLAALRTNAHADARVARGRFPLLIFSHGFLMYPRQNSALMERLASAGYVVLSVAHPGDAADLPSSRGMLLTRMVETAPDPDPKAMETFWSAPDLAAQSRLLPTLWQSPRVQAMEQRLETWRSDLTIVADAAMGAKSPSPLRAIAGAIRKGGLAYGGMSFGGSASASACVRDARCQAAFNLDGIEFDRTLYDRDIGKPLLLIQSDWIRYPNAGPEGRAFTSYDLAYERRATAGRNGDIHRYRLDGIRHLGLSDLILLPNGPARDAMLGPLAGDRATAAIGALTQAFLDRYLGGKDISIAAAAQAYPELVRHSAGAAPAAGERQGH